MAEEIIIEIGPTGDVTVEGKGIAGTDCVKLTEALEEALGDVTQKKLKADYRMARAATRKVGA